MSHDATSGGTQAPAEQWDLDPAFEPRHPTGMGNARRFVDQHHRDLKYAHVWRRWLVWDGRRFIPDDTGEVIRRAKATTASIYAEAAQEENPADRKRIAAWAMKSESEAHLREMVNLAACEMPVRPEELDANPWRLTVENGTLDLRTGELYPHSRDDLGTKLAPVRFEKDGRCPTWLSFLDQILGGDPVLIAFLQRAVGYSLTGDTREQLLFFLHGTGCNGKSTLLELLGDLLGDYAQQADFTTFLERRGEGPRNDIARLHGARFVASIEAGEGHRLAEGLVKQLTGGDTIAARFLYREAFEFRPSFKLWLAANHKPVIRGTDHAIWRRIRLIPFTVTIPDGKRDRDLPAKLRAELPGILRWAIEGCLAWQHDGLGTPPAVREATEAYRSEMDVLAAFLDECCELKPGARVGATPLFQAYRDWASRSGERSSTQTAFGASLGERSGLTKVRDSRTGRWVWHGIALLNSLNSSEQSGGISPMNGAREEKYRKSAQNCSDCSAETQERLAIQGEGAG